MVKKHHKIISLLLCLMLAFSALYAAGTVGASAAAGDTIYVRANNGWTDLYCYMWNSESDKNAAWPGVKMTQVESGVYSYTLPKAYANLIFNNNGNGSNQTTEIDYPSDANGKIYDLTSKTWSAYAGAATSPTSAQTTTSSSTTTTVASTTTGSSTGGVTVYLENELGWSTPYCYMWNSESDKNAAWPGVKMTSLGGNVYKYTAAKVYAKCIFNIGSDSAKTGDLTTNDGCIYNNSTNSWEVYDTSDLQVTAYSADPDANVYTGTDITLSAQAQNVATSASVSYKFSVTNASGSTSVISNYSSANSVVWTPTVAGTYTITFDFKDTAGNTNSRTLSITINDDSTLVKPVIKGVSPANLNLIGVNTAATVSVRAGGGKTGTNLLFYKYVVTDPNGVQNTPYYTLNSTYTFTPTLLGTYTVNVYVQGSDNSTVNKTYTYTSTSSAVISTTAPVVTTSPVTTTAPIATTKPVTTTAPVATTKPVTTQPTTTAVKIVGDANGDGVVSILDCTYIQKSIAELAGVPSLDELDKTVCDVDGDGRVSVKDVTRIQMIIAQIDK